MKTMPPFLSAPDRKRGHSIGGKTMEWLDIVDENGVPTGRRAERAQVHACGLLHRTAHVWIVRKRWGTWQILLQKRSDKKDAYPGCYDISSAGHLPAGEDFVPAALRELKEELGYTAVPEQLIFCGRRRFHFSQVFHGKPFHDNQISNIYLLQLDQAPEQFVLQADEVSEVRWFDLSDCFRHVAAGSISHCIFPEELEMVRQGIAALENQRKVEYLDIYDAQKRPTGKKRLRDSKLPPDAYQLIAFAVILNTQGQMLLTLRAPEKQRYPNLWGNTGGAVQAGETSLQAIVREVWEETGIRAEPSDFTLLDTYQNSVNRSFTDVYLLVKDVPLEQMTMQPGETVDARWVRIEEAEQMMADGRLAKPDADRWPALKPLVMTHR